MYCECILYVKIKDTIIKESKIQYQHQIDDETPAICKPGMLP